MDCIETRFLLIFSKLCFFLPYEFQWGELPTWNVSSSSQWNSLRSFGVPQSLAFPMLSTSIFSSNGSMYEKSAIFNPQFQLRVNQAALDVLIGLLASNSWANLTSNLAVSLWLNIFLIRGLINFPTDQIGAMIAHIFLSWGVHARDWFKLSYQKEQPDPHYQVSYDRYELLVLGAWPIDMVSLTFGGIHLWSTKVLFTFFILVILVNRKLKIFNTYSDKCESTAQSFKVRKVCCRMFF